MGILDAFLGIVAGSRGTPAPNISGPIQPTYLPQLFNTPSAAGGFLGPEQNFDDPEVRAQQIAINALRVAENTGTQAVQLLSRAWSSLGARTDAEASRARELIEQALASTGGFTGQRRGGLSESEYAIRQIYPSERSLDPGTVAAGGRGAELYNDILERLRPGAGRASEILRRTFGEAPGSAIQSNLFPQATNAGDVASLYQQYQRSAPAGGLSGNRAFGPEYLRDLATRTRGATAPPEIPTLPNIYPIPTPSNMVAPETRTDTEAGRFSRDVQAVGPVPRMIEPSNPLNNGESYAPPARRGPMVGNEPVGPPDFGTPSNTRPTRVLPPVVEPQPPLQPQPPVAQPPVAQPPAIGTPLAPPPPRMSVTPPAPEPPIGQARPQPQPQLPDETGTGGPPQQANPFTAVRNPDFGDWMLTTQGQSGTGFDSGQPQQFSTGASGGSMALRAVPWAQASDALRRGGATPEELRDLESRWQAGRDGAGQKTSSLPAALQQVKARFQAGTPTAEDFALLKRGLQAV